ncbi:MAG: hypothetical protein ACR2IM_08095, partial [Sediminibacterium sp.]
IVSIDILNEMFQHPEKANPKSFSETVLLNTHLKLLSQVQDKEAYQKVLNEVHQAQIESLQQFNNNISLKNIINITERKGGFSLLMCRHYIKLKASQNLDNCWYQLGGMIQMTNDLYDIYKDTVAGIHTFANTQNTYENILENYEDQVNKFIESIHQLHYNKADKLKLQIKLSLITALGYIALENLKILQGKNKELLPFKSYPRKDLIIDMEKIKNIIKMFKYSYQVAFK